MALRLLRLLLLLLARLHEHARLTDTSLPRLISASTFFTPSPLPTCQMVASTGWLVMGQSRACSSYQIVLKGKEKKKKKNLNKVNSSSF